jgi:[protein-PII] uridylyltransferase
MNVDTNRLRTFLAAQQRDIAASHQRGEDGFATCTALTATMDEAIRTAFQMLSPSLEQSSKGNIAVLALGGYGRAELFPKSDIDVMILCASGDQKEAAGQVAKEFLHLLWDVGVDIGHSVRTVDEALALRGRSADAWASMIESRFVCGNHALATQLYSALRKKLSADHERWFVEQVFSDLASRHQRHGQSVKLLEPNIKKSAGGLRDMHAVFWLHRATDPAFFTPIDPAQPACEAFLSHLLQNNRLEPEEHATAIAALQFLFRTRHEMHYRRDSLHDTLEYMLQLEVAEGLGFGPRNELRSVEVFMREYYLHARNIHQLHRRLSQQFRELMEPVSREPHDEERVGDFFILYDSVLSIDPRVKRLPRALDLLEAFVLAAENDAGLDFRLRWVIERSIGLLTMNELHSAELASMFRRILQSKRVAETLHAMNELGVLGRYIPEFGELVAFFQHNVYHYFTADEHTLIAIANAEHLREERGVLHEVFHAIRRKDVLYLAVLLHDIAKPHGVADHEITGVGLARTILDRLGMSDAFADVAFLVRNHLVMEQTAFRRNIHDAQTIKEFAARFDRAEQLDYLYLLTYADLSALNINVWTEWKSSMLQDLYSRASEVLKRDLHGAQIDEFHKSKQEAAMMGVVDKLSVEMSREEVERHLRGMQSDAYVSIFTEEEIGKHIQYSRVEGPVTTLFAQAEGYTEVTVIGQDAPFALSKFCAVLSANDANIFDANVFTRDDGLIIDRFRVADASTRQQLEQRVCGKIAEDLKQVMAGTLDIEHLFQAHRRRWKRRAKLPVNPTVRIGVEFEDNPRYTIIDVYAPDSVGFLYRITETISKLGLDIYFAKIATRVDGIVDAFYTLDRAGQPLIDAEQREAIRQEILNTIRMMTEEELA